MTGLFAVLHLFALSAWFGALVFWSFVATPKLFAVYERRMAGEIVGLVFPRYYVVGATCGVLALLTAPVISAPPGTVPLMGVLVTLTVYAGTLLRWKMEEVKAQRRSAEDEDTPEADALAARFGRLHGFSMLLNLAVILGVAVALLRLAARLGGAA